MPIDDYIKRSDAISAIHAVPPGNRTWARYADNVACVPAADVEPKRKTGWWKRIQWVKDEDGQEGGYWILRCSECVMPYHSPTLYCPHCGAKMMSDDEIADGIGQTFSPD